jgi:hypothetical protein
MRELVTGNEVPKIVAHRCIIEASIGRNIVQTIEAPHSPGHTSNIGSIVHIVACFTHMARSIHQCQPLKHQTEKHAGTIEPTA